MLLSFLVTETPVVFEMFFFLQGLKIKISKFSPCVTFDGVLVKSSLFHIHLCHNRKFEYQLNQKHVKKENRANKEHPCSVY